MKVDTELFLQELALLVNTDTGQGDPAGILAIGRFFTERFAALGYLAEVFPLGEGIAPCFVFRNREAQNYDVMLVGHLDTVFAPGEAERRPFRREGGRAYGPGVLDMKQGALAILHVLEALPREVSDRLNILVILNPDEEIGSVYSRELIDRYAAHCRFAFVFEAASTDGARTTRRKGRYNATVTFRGKAGHAGFLFENGAVSAIRELVFWASQLDTLTDRAHGTSVNIGQIAGGEAFNIVADRARMSFEVRYESEGGYARLLSLLETLKMHARDAGVGTVFEECLCIPPLVPGERTVRYEERLRLLGERSGIPYFSRGRGGLSDANHISRFADVTVDGLAPTGDHDHSEREYLEISTIATNLRFVYLMLCDLPDAIAAFYPSKNKKETE